jgi:Outer membrane protein beta-barrel domain
MKKGIRILQLACAVILCSVTLSTIVIAQSKRAGIKGGLNISNLYLNDVTDENARLGLHAGIYGQLVSSDVFALQTELLFSTKGSHAKYSDGAFQQEVKYNLNYLDLPVLAVFKIGELVELHAGGYASYLLNANISYSGDLANGLDEVDQDNLKSFDYGLVGGVGFNFGNIQIGARYNLGLVELADSSIARTVIGDVKNSCAQLFIAFNLRAN